MYVCARGSSRRSVGASARRMPIEPWSWAIARVGASTTSARVATAKQRRSTFPTYQAAEWVIVPAYVPMTALAGMVTMIVGFHVADVLPTPLAMVNAVRGTDSASAWAASTCPGENTPTPATAVATPDQYDT